MEAEARLRERAVIYEAGLDEDSTLSEGFEVARSVCNISLWKSYLPLDCVDAMISMGWNYST